MKLSVPMPVYNELATLDLAVKKVLDADYPCEMGLIIVDDGSTDGTRDLNPAITSDPRVVLEAVYGSPTFGSHNAYSHLYVPGNRAVTMEAEITGKLLRCGIRPYEVPISYKARSREAGKKLTWRAGVKAVLLLARERLSPVRLQ